MKVKINFQLLNRLFAIRESVTNLDEQNETIDKIEKAIEILVTSEPATTEPKSKFEELLSDTFQGFKPTVATMEELNEDLYQRYLQMIEWYICEAGGEMFSPEFARRDYDVDFTKLQLNKHYKTHTSVLIGANGAKPSLYVSFTDEGIRELIRTYPKIREKIEDEWKEYQAETQGGAK